VAALERETEQLRDENTFVRRQLEQSSQELKLRNHDQQTAIKEAAAKYEALSLKH